MPGWGGVWSCFTRAISGFSLWHSGGRGGVHGAGEVTVRRGCAILDGRVAARRAVSRDAQRAGQHRARPGGQGGAACAELRRRGRTRRPHVGAAGQLRARAHRPAGGRDDRSHEAADRRRRPARRARSRDRRHEARERNRRRAARRPRGLLRRLPAEAGSGADDRRRLPRRGGLSRGGREAPPRGRRQADRHRQLSGRLADHDDGGGPAGAGRRDHAGRNAALLLGRGSRQEPDALPRRHARRHVADRARRRHGRRDFRRRRASSPISSRSIPPTPFGPSPTTSIPRSIPRPSASSNSKPGGAARCC